MKSTAWTMTSLLIASCAWAGVQPVDVPSVVADEARPAWSDCDSLGPSDVRVYDPAEQYPVEGYWLSDKGARCILGDAQMCDRLLLIEQDLGKSLATSIDGAADRIERQIGKALGPWTWLEDPRLWFAGGVVAGAAAVVLGGWAVSAVAR